MAAMTLRNATAADFPFIHALTSRPENAPFITDEDDAALAAYVASDDSRLLIWEPEGRPAGYALYCELGDPAGAVELRRLALDAAGRGAGAAFVRALMDHAFTTFGARRLWLDASSENPRAQKTYDRAGFTLEGRLRAHWYRPTLGRNVDLMLYGMLRAEWEALEPLSPGA
jgi:RimJ/RimL family protein N-acetyltransferase